MPAPLAAARFLLSTILPGAIRGVDGTIAVGGERLRLRTYGAPSARAQVLALHGLTLRGVEDPRMDRVCRSIAATGCRVWAPELPDTARLRITIGDLERVTALMEDLSKYGPLGVFAPSFSATLALRAAVDRRDVSGICAVGAGGDVLRTVRHVLEAPGADPYGRVVLFRNFAPAALDWSPALLGALDGWLADDSLRRTPSFARARAALSPGERATFDGLLRGEPAVTALAGRVLDAGAAVLGRLDLVGVAARIRAPVVLVHGAGDAVVPPSESILLGRLLPDAQVCVTPLLGHGDVKLRLDAVGQVAAVHRAFSRWFGAVLGRPVGYVTDRRDEC